MSDFLQLNVSRVATSDLARGLFRVEFRAMGTTCEIQFQCNDEGVAGNFKEAALDWVRNFEATYTRFEDSSLVSRINRAAGRDWVAIDPETEALFDLCDRFHFITRGLFDPTNLPIIELWDYKARHPRIPTDEEIGRAKDLVGWDKVKRKPGRVYLEKVGMGIDLGGIGKEYAVDSVALLARDFGIGDVLINFGGDVAALGHPPGYTHWHIGMEDPGNPGKCWGSLALNDLCVASSGDYRRFFDLNGKRYGHIVDHRKGYPIANKVQHVTVVAGTCTESGILATAACLLGEEEGMELINRFFGAEGCLHTKFKRIDSHGIYHYMVSD
ncbi:MAG: FAD:protein FMN transferase [Opitutae bacterium]|nr:FAD:protein FMN transferase [Opitutae bacterium]